jgi:hypothetical protein
VFDDLKPRHWKVLEALLAHDGEALTIEVIRDTGLTGRTTERVLDALKGVKVTRHPEAESQWKLAFSHEEVKGLLDLAFGEGSRKFRQRALDLAMTHIHDATVTHGYLITCPPCWSYLLKKEREQQARTGKTKRQNKREPVAA